MTSLQTIRDFIRFAVTEAAKHELWYGHGTDNVWDEMTALVLGSLSLPQPLAAQWFSARLTSDEKTHVTQQLQKRLLQKVPVPYLTQTAYFCGAPYYVDERVLIPRSPLAELIEQAFTPWVDPEQVHHVLDLCTGSGCLAIACAYAFPEAQVDAVDISSEALAVAAINVQRHHMTDTVQLIQSDLWTNLPSTRYDLIISNPPYVGEASMRTLPAEYRHEPVLALQAEDQGLALVHRILAQAKDYLTPQGVLIVEVGESEEAVVAAYPEVPFVWLEFERGGQGVFVLTAAELNKI